MAAMLSVPMHYFFLHPMLRAPARVLEEARVLEDKTRR